MINSAMYLLTFVDTFVHQFKFYILCFLVCAMHLLVTSALSMTEANSSDQVRLLSRNQSHFIQLRECSRRIGPFATQDRAWAEWRRYRSDGYSVSQGVVPCYSEYGRGYCFFVYWDC